MGKRPSVLVVEDEVLLSMSMRLCLKEHGYAVLDRIIATLEDLAKVEQPARMAGRRMKLLLVPK